MLNKYQKIEFIINVVASSFMVHINQRLPYQLQKKLAEKKVIRQIKYAYENVPYYRKKYDQAGVDIKSISRIKDLKKIPFITKNEIRSQFPNNIVAKDVDIDRCIYSATTGSTGRSLPFVYSVATYAFYLATNLRVYTMMGCKPWHKTVYIKYTAVDSMSMGPFFNTAHIPSVIPVEKQIAMLKKEKPDLLDGYASIIFEIAQRMTKDDLQYIKPKMILVNSEMSTQYQRDFISKIFNCPVYDEYSTEETWMVSSQCKNHNYHIFTDNVWVEFLDKDGNDVKPGETGEMVLTTLKSPVMPFIRYRIGDLGRMSEKRCTCSSNFPILVAFDGRSDDSFILPSGKYVSSLKILNTFTMYIKEYLHLMEEFKVVQKKKDLIQILLVKGREYNKGHFQKLLDSLHEIFGEPVTINVEFVEKIPMHESIKRKAIESLVNKKQLKQKN